jgi:hypothetical protein
MNRTIGYLALYAATEALAVGPDPGVRIEVSSRRDKVRPTRGTVTITAIVKNVGNAPYISRPGQQNVQLLETASGATTGGAVKATCDFPTLNVGQEVRCSWSRPWDIAIEFQPSYQALIVYDPDILLDSNPKNDDASNKNNTAFLSWTAVNATFH